MQLLFRLLIVLVGLFYFGLGGAFLLRPEEMLPNVHLLPDGLLGMASARADFPALFIGCGLFSFLGAWRTDPEPLKVPLVLMVVALLGRSLSLVMDGFQPAALEPMLIDAILIVIMVGGIMAFRDATPGPDPL